MTIDGSAGVVRNGRRQENRGIGGAVSTVFGDLIGTLIYGEYGGLKHEYAVINVRPVQMGDVWRDRARGRWSAPSTPVYGFLRTRRTERPRSCATTLERRRRRFGG